MKSENSTRETKPNKISLGDIARIAGISTTSAGCALRNLPGVSEKTRRQVLQIAERLGYFPDPRLSTRMAGIRQTINKDLLPVVWLNSEREKDAWKQHSYLAPYREGAQKCLQTLGYRIEEIWTRTPGFTMRRLAQTINYQRISGVFITGPCKHIRLKWDELAAVSIGEGLMAPPLHRVATDIVFNFGLALKMVKRFGYRRIGVSLTEEADRFSRHGIRFMISYFNQTLPKSRRVEPLFMGHVGPYEDERLFPAWIKKERPDVIIGANNLLVQWVKKAGFSVPREVGIVHIATDDDVIDWAGVYANKREVGRVAAEKLVSLMEHRQYGIPEVASTTFVPGIWRPGSTLLAPKLKVRESALCAA
ncbi:MAG: LacI family transcriptional regulator [Methylacidiphilales bacterium]|nr:LacI family transcriptional regulator [Candidatus Methylacidiphilales bacterium]